MIYRDQAQLVSVSRYALKLSHFIGAASGTEVIAMDSAMPKRIVNVIWSQFGWPLTQRTELSPFASATSVQ